MKNNNAFMVLSFVLLLSVSACSSGGGGASNDGGSNSMPSVVTKVYSSVSVTICPAGGIQVDAGIDTNGNGVLDAAEVKSTQYVCNGLNGSNGSNGTNGLTTLVSIVTEPVGTNCVNGGTKVNVGVDSDRSGVLDSTEVTSSDYVCNGTNGSNGGNGANGNNGLNSLITIVTEPAGTNCTTGGVKITSGTDSDNDNFLDAAEATSMEYVCSGATGVAGGGGITWVEEIGTAVQAVSNYGYLTNSSSQVAITLPLSPGIGDVVRVSGVGAGGWKVTQNVGQSVITKDISISASWKAHEFAKMWESVASSADGNKLVAGEFGGSLITSTDSGATWTQRDTGKLWRSIASSSDGAMLVVGVYSGEIYTSSDSGETWTNPVVFGSNVQSVASSTDGSKLIVATSSGPIYTSINSGVTWTSRESNRDWVACASSADGSKLVAGAWGDYIYTSSDSGATWIPRDSQRNWQSIASSANGTKLVAVARPGRIFTSTDSGQTWTQRESNRNWWSVASSADGVKLIAAVANGQIYTSTDSGVSWIPRESSKVWMGVASSSDGNKVVAVENGGDIYTQVLYNTTVGTAGSISGSQYDAIELQYTGNSIFLTLSHEGSLIVQ